MVLFKTSIFLLMFYLDILSITVSWLLKSQTIIVQLSNSLFSSVNIYFICLGLCLVSMFIIVINY